MRIIVGAGGVSQPGWIPTEISSLNLLTPATWETFFSAGSIDAILAEHVWEHLTIEESVSAAETCFKYLRAGGYLRAAVPDGLHPDPIYIEWVRPGGTGLGADEHKVLFTHDTFRQVFESVGFRVEMLEYFNEAGQFVKRKWDPKDGLIHRSIRFDQRNYDGNPRFTSIILDAWKPEIDVAGNAKPRVLAPISNNWGFERGGSLDRFYIDPFVRRSLQGRHGKFLEFGRPTYRRFVDPGSIESYEILDIVPDNPEATVVGDIETLNAIADNTLDVIICTQVLQLVRHPQRAINKMLGLLRPSGLLILSVPFISKACDESSDRWRFSNLAVAELLSSFATSELVVAGNLFSSIGFLLGLGLDDVSPEDLTPIDPQHYLVVLASGTK